MIIRWGRKGLFAGAYAATFITAAVATTYVNEIQHRPSHKQEVKYVTPATAAATSIKRAYVRPGISFEFRHITPSVEPAGKTVGIGGGHADKRKVFIEEENEIIMAVIQAFLEVEG